MYIIYVSVAFLSRTGHVFLALHQEQGIILKLFIFMSRVRLSSTQKFGVYPPGVFGFSSCASRHLPLCMELQTSDFECMYIRLCVFVG